MVEDCCSLATTPQLGEMSALKESSPSVPRGAGHILSDVPDIIDILIETPEGTWMVPTECPDLREKHLSCRSVFLRM